MAYNPNAHYPAAYYGLRPGFTIADLEFPYSHAIQVITNATANTTSAPVDQGLRSISLYATFVHQNTSCDITVTDGNSAVVAFFPGVNYASDGLNVGSAEGVDLQGKPFTVSISNVQNSSNINIFAKATS